MVAHRRGCAPVTARSVGSGGQDGRREEATGEASRRGAPPHRWRCARTVRGWSVQTGRAAGCESFSESFRESTREARGGEARGRIAGCWLEGGCRWFEARGCRFEACRGYDARGHAAAAGVVG